jgi:hypothetical protein
LPHNGKVGELVGQQHPFPLLQIDEKVLRLAPGGRIFDRDNRVILHTFLPAKAQVLYVLDTNGDVSRAYILRPEEWEQLKPPPAPPAPDAPPKKSTKS